MTRAGRLGLWALLLLLSGCEGERENPLPSVGESPRPPGIVEAPPCSDVECAALAGVCREARCEARTGECRVAAARDGEPCLEGNPCGASECRAGECVPLAPPACAELSDACWSGVCRPDIGCIAERRAIPGTDGVNAVRLVSKGVGLVTASSSCPDQPSVPLNCAQGLTGPSSIFELDLRDATELTRARLIVDARFAFEAALTRGPSDDPAVVHCAEPFYSLGDSRMISAELEPDRYHLIVTGRSEGDRGSISVTSDVGTPDAPVPAANDDCATPLLLDVTLDQQTLIPNTLDATPQVTSRCAAIGSADVFYELDLSGRSSEVMLDVDVSGGGSVSLFPMGSETCTEILTCASWWSRRLSPGTYKLGLHFDPDDVVDNTAVRVGLSEESCPSPVNDTAETALDLDPTLAKQHIRGNTACGNDDVSTACSDDRGAPDLFYRLDLRNHTKRQRLQTYGVYEWDLLAYLMVPSGDAGELRPNTCGAPSSLFLLAPRLYYLVIDGRAQYAGRFDVELTLRDAYTNPPDCEQDQGMFRYCLPDSEPACLVSLAHPDCIRTAVECGLSPEALAAFCTAYPGCCDGTAPTESCEAPWDEAAITCSP